MPCEGRDYVPYVIIACIFAFGVLVLFLFWLGLRDDPKDQARRERAESVALPVWMDAHAPEGRFTCPLINGPRIFCDVTAPNLPGVVRVACENESCWFSQ